MVQSLGQKKTTIPSGQEEPEQKGNKHYFIMTNDYVLETEILKKHLEFIREEIKRFQTSKDELRHCSGAKSDDAGTLLGDYGRITFELNALLRHSYDADPH